MYGKENFITTSEAQKSMIGVSNRLLYSGIPTGTMCAHNSNLVALRFFGPPVELIFAIQPLIYQ